VDRHHQHAPGRGARTAIRPLRFPIRHLVTDFEKLVELRNSLQPESAVHDRVLAGGERW
jgi:hypothetical protein